MPNQPQAPQGQQNNQMKQTNQQNQQNQKPSANAGNNSANAGNKESEMNRNANTTSGAKPGVTADARNNERNGNVGKDTGGDGRPVAPGHKSGEIDGDRQNRK